MDILSTRDRTSFGVLLNKVSQYGVKQCSSYSYAARNNFTRYAIQYIVGQKLNRNIKLTIKYIFKNKKLYRNNRNLLLPSDLDTLGPCFAPNLPIEYFRNMTADQFFSKINYFQGTQFVPDNDWCAELTNKITYVLLLF